MKLKITFIQDGMREFEETGIYPEYLLFNLLGTRQSWRVNLNQIATVAKKSSLAMAF